MKLFLTILCIGLVSADTRPYLPAQKPTAQPKQAVSHVSTVVSNQNIPSQEVFQVQHVQHVQQVHQVQTPQNPAQVVVTPVVSPQPIQIVSTSQTYKPTAQVITTQTYQPAVTGTYHVAAAGCSVSCNEHKCIQGCLTPTYTQTSVQKPPFSVYGRKSVPKTPVQKTVTVTKEVQTKPVQRTVTIQEHIVPVVRTVVHTVPVVQRTVVQTVPVVQRTIKTVQYQQHSVVQTGPVSVQTSHVVPAKEVTVLQTFPGQKKVVQASVVTQAPETVVPEKQTVAPAVVPVSTPQKETVAIFPTQAPVLPVLPVKPTYVHTTKHHVPGHNEVSGYRYSGPAAH